MLAMRSRLRFDGGRLDPKRSRSISGRNKWHKVCLSTLPKGGYRNNERGGGGGGGGGGRGGGLFLR